MKKKTKYLSTAQRRILKKRTTLAEETLWNELRKNSFGCTFIRQKEFIVLDAGRVRKFTVDFYCPESNLVIEADGEVHKKKIEFDRIRTTLLQEQFHVVVIRFTNNEICCHTHGVIDKIKNMCKTLILHRKDSAGNKHLDMQAY
ncbi:MAG: DUF559 domain-containing protein [Fibrobacter sp.]|nr:DUF559 domain-containing protein [Fibrobacter sp.]